VVLADSGLTFATLQGGVIFYGCCHVFLCSLTPTVLTERDEMTAVQAAVPVA
jgi:hypothetical protein